MNRFTFFLWVLFLPASINAQEDFAPVGAEWYYGIGYGCCSGAGYQHFTVEKDTTYLGELCKKVNVIRYDPAGNINEHFIFYTYNQNDSVFISYNDNFYLLYNFGLNIGDTLKILVPFDYIDMEYEDTILTQTVSSIETVTVDDLLLKRIYFNHPDYIDYYGPYYEYYTQKLGGSNYFFPFEWDFSTDQISPGLRCYSDSVITYKLISKCDTLKPPEYIINYGTLINKIWISENYINISLNDLKIISLKLKITLMDISGRTIYVTDIENTSEIYSINLNGLTKGIYFIRISTGDLNVSHKIAII